MYTCLQGLGGNSMRSDIGHSVSMSYASFAGVYIRAFCKHFMDVSP